ncbi:resistance to Congo red protein ASCRUDRAFT_69923 [Ascoidea rubescens DSM 1968]|uniref:Uncharacterized protein n=1 Tax=Ascoidea rubescens DSM 1968 TaxID=1344418 RepID=A0A1D2VIE1_9ASCO|nr:hypothetical protein ASCRUDRAFT_69923 [Ascoidea rubescens DSM 1968]ODV61421.1 hypothetical protein ASCRUDRAFT_69923 [Ascoidea rubescens DSM 1968]
MPFIAELQKRQTVCGFDSFGRYRCYQRSNWHWARWLLFIILLVAAILLVFLFTCLKTRKRAKSGQAPIKYTTWMLPPSYRHSQQQYNKPEDYNPNKPPNQETAPPYPSYNPPFNPPYNPPTYPPTYPPNDNSNPYDNNLYNRAPVDTPGSAENPNSSDFINGYQRPAGAPPAHVRD